MANLNVTVTDGMVIRVDLGENAVGAANSAAAAGASAAAAEAASATALAASGPNYADTAAGSAATDVGDAFAVDEGDTIAVYRHDAGPVATFLRRFPKDITASSGAGLIGTADGGTVQEAINTFADVDASLIDLGNVLPVSSATALAITDLNKLVIASGSTAYTINLPAATAAGSAVKLEIARTTTALVTIQAASGSGKTVNGAAIFDMIAGESALFVYDGTNWRVLDWVRVPISAELVSSGAAQSLTSGSFNDIILDTQGSQLMATDLSALWNATPGYFTMPRGGTYRVDCHFWVTHSTGPGQYDVGVYPAATGGGSPANRYFARQSVGTEVFRTLNFTLVTVASKGLELYPTVRPNSPLTAASLVAAATLTSRMTVTEILR